MTMFLSGKPVAQDLRLKIVREVDGWREKGIVPRMVTILVEGDAASKVYAEQKARIAKKMGIQNELLVFPGDVQTKTLCSAIQACNENPAVHGIMLELPLPPSVDGDAVVHTIDRAKDVDGLRGQFPAEENSHGALYPATPLACVRLLKYYGFSLAGKDVVLVGCGRTVGMPLFHLLVKEQATVTVCHAFTRSLEKHIQHADIAFVAVGKENLIQPDMIHPNLVIVDAGINETADGGIVGDVHPDVATRVLAMTPTPGGVGAVTPYQLFSNLLRAVKQQYSVRHRVVIHTP